MYPCFAQPTAHPQACVERLLVVLHAGVGGSPGQDGDMWDWFTPVGWPDSRDAATEVTYPTRLVQQIKSEEEMAHDYLDTRVKNSTGEASVSCPTEKKTHLFHPHLQLCLFSHSITLLSVSSQPSGLNLGEYFNLHSNCMWTCIGVTVPRQTCLNSAALSSPLLHGDDSAGWCCSSLYFM